MFIDILNPSVVNKRYGIIYSDPAWEQTKGNIRACRPNQRKNLDYNTCSLMEIESIHKNAFELCDDKCNVFMWTIDKYLFQTEKMMENLGYVVHARLIWDKCNGVAPAFTVRYSHEYLLWFYRKGHMLMPSSQTRGKYTTVIREKSTVHSHKPECVYKMLDEMFPSVEKLELFARNGKDGWDNWGNQTDLFEIVV